MALLAPDVGEVEILKRVFNVSAANNVVYKLYQNNATPAESDTTAQYTEPSTSGYTAVSLTGTSFTVTTATGTTTARYAIQTYTFASAATIYGYFVTVANGTTLMYAEKFASSLVMPTGGGTLTLVPLVTCD